MLIWPDDLSDRCAALADSCSSGVQLDLRLRGLIEEIGLPGRSGEIEDLPATAVDRMKEGADPEAFLVRRIGELVWEMVWDNLVNPDLEDGLIRGAWMLRNGFDFPALEEAAVRSGFRFRFYAENLSSGDLPQGFDSAGFTGQLFAAIFHGGKLRAGFKFSELGSWTGDQRLPEEIRQHPVVRALDLVGKFGAHPTSGAERVGYLLDLEEIWSSGNEQAQDLLVHALFLAHPFDGQGDLIVKWSHTFFDEHPSSTSNVMRYYLARGHRLNGNYEIAYSEILRALAGLRANDTTSAEHLFEEQYSREREMIVMKREIDRTGDELLSQMEDQLAN